MLRPWIVVDNVITHPSEVIGEFGRDLRDLGAGASEGEVRIVYGRKLDDKAISSAVLTAFTEASRRTGIIFDEMEPIELLRYTAGGEYSWHADNEFIYGEHRKLSAVIALNDDYEGGDTEFMWPRPGASEVVHLGASNAVIFPSLMYHRARPTLGGERWVIVAWAAGLPFR